MPGILEQSDTRSRSRQRSAADRASRRVDTLPSQKGSTGLLVLVAVHCGLFILCFANMPLWHTDLWDHVNYGRQLLSAGELSPTEPLLTTTNEPMVWTAWGSQVLMALAMKSPETGLPLLQLVSGLLAILAMWLIANAVLRKTGAWFPAVCSALVLLAVNWQQFKVFRPQLAGVTLFSLLIATMTDSRHLRRRNFFILLPLMFAVWANLHGSFAMGLTFLGTLTVGHFLDLVIRLKSVPAAMSSKRLKRLVVCIFLCSAAALINPNGWLLYREILVIGRHPNIASMFEWNALSWQMNQGKATAIAVLVLGSLLVVRYRRARFQQLLPLMTFLGLSLWSSRMLNWFAPLCGIATGLHLAAVLPVFGSSSTRPDRWAGFRLVTSAAHMTGILVLCVATLAATSFCQRLFGSSEIPASRLLTSRTPVAVGEWLADQHSEDEGTAFVPAEWSGYLMFRSARLRPMVNLHVHVIPPDVWRDYLRLHFGTGDLQQLAAEYNLTTMIVDVRRNRRLERRLAEDPSWREVFRDQQSAVYGLVRDQKTEEESAKNTGTR